MSAAQVELDPLDELRALARELGRQARNQRSPHAIAEAPIPGPRDTDWTITGYVVDRLYRQSRRGSALLADAHPRITADAYRAGYTPERPNRRLPPRGASA